MGNKHSRREDKTADKSPGYVEVETGDDRTSQHTHNTAQHTHNTQHPSTQRQNAHYQHDDTVHTRTSDSSVSMREALESLSPVDMMPRKYSRDITPQPILSLMTIDPDSIPDVPCKDALIHAYIYDVYDGDTVRFLMLSGGNEGSVIKLSLRLLGIDTPEIRGGQGHLSEEKTAGEMSRNRLAEIIGARVSKDPRASKPRKSTLTKIIIRDWDKFGGRVLGDIILHDGRSVVDIMIAEGYGRRYNGDKKIPWTMEDLSQPPFRLI